MTPEAKLITYLFAKGEPIQKRSLSAILQIDPSAAEAAIAAAKMALSSTGLCMVDDGSEIELRTDSSASEMVEQIRKDEFSRDLGKAGLETLAILLYKGPSSRSEIDYIRGVNSTYTLRTLSMRALVRRIPNPKDERGYIYEPTIELLSHLGVTSVENLPDFSETKRRIAELEASAETDASAHAKEADADPIES